MPNYESLRNKVEHMILERYPGEQTYNVRNNIKLPAGCNSGTENAEWAVRLPNDRIC